MTRKPKILFLEIAAGGGHLSITQAIIESLHHIAPQAQPIRLDFNHTMFGKGYELSVRNYPNVYNLLFKATNYHHIKKIISKTSQAFTSRYINEAILHHKPQVIVSNTIFGITEIPHLVQKTNKHIPFLFFVPDPFTPHSIYYQPQADLTMVSSLTAYQRGLKNGLSPEKLVITGHPIREAFFNSPNNISKLRSQLNLNPNLPTFVLGGSGGGIEKTQEILQFLQDLHPPDCQIIVLCGNHTSLAQDIQSQEFPSWMKIHTIGHIPNVADYLHASDFIAAKAGPNIMLESLSAGKPFIVTHHIHGQENGNVDFIRSTQCGFVEENPKHAASLIANILHNPAILQNAQPGVEFVRNQHRPAAKTIASYISRYI